MVHTTDGRRPQGKDGEHILESDALRVTVSDAGAELLSVVDREKGAERIWVADPAVWNRHAPLLFPFVGKVTGGRYRLGERTWEMKTQHGFARDMDFVCLEATEASVRHQLTATERTMTIYPFAFRLTVTHALKGRRLDIRWRVENEGDDRMYFAIGGHPGFLLPSGVRKEDCSIFFPGRDTLYYRGANAAGFLLPEVKTLSLREEHAPYQADIPDTWVFEDGQVRSVGIALPDGRPYVLLHCDSFPMLAVWANPRGSFICLEPWFGRTDDEGFDGTVDQKKGIQCLAKGEGKDFGYAIDFM